MRAFFIKINRENDRQAHVRQHWLRLGGIIVERFDFSTRYVFTDCPLIWKHSDWITIWTTSRVPESAFFMAPAQWIFTQSERLTHTTIPGHQIKRQFDKALFLAPIEQKQEDRLQCQYPGCTQSVVRGQYDSHLLAHLREDQLIDVLDWWQISAKRSAECKAAKKPSMQLAQLPTLVK